MGYHEWNTNQSLLHPPNFHSEILSRIRVNSEQSPHPAQKLWVYSEFLSFFSLYSRLLADFPGHLGKWSNWSNLRLKMSVCALGRLKNHNVPHLHPNFTMFMLLNRLQLKICAFSGKFNVCSKWVLLSWIEIYRDFMLQTQIFTQKYRSWLRFYSEFLRKNLVAGVSVLNSSPT